jgi:endo-1,4-beta-D-glucanase Y
VCLSFAITPHYLLRELICIKSAAVARHATWKAGRANSSLCFIVRDHNGQAFAYVYFEEQPGRRAAAKLLAKNEARRIAANIANKLPELRGRRNVDQLPLS